MKHERKSARRAVIVLGMHRSGTSCLASALQPLGVHLGDNLVGPAPDNERGFFEDREIHSINESILERFARRWDTTRPFEDSAWRECELADLTRRAEAYLDAEFGDSHLWGFKDPRACLLLPFWLGVLERVGCEPVAVVGLRNPLDIAASLRERDGFPIEKSHCLWMLHMAGVLRMTEEIPRIFVDYDRLLESPEQELARLAGFLGLPAPAPEAQAIGDRSLRHNKSDRSPAGPLEEFVVAANQSLSGAAADGSADIPPGALTLAMSMAMHCMRPSPAQLVGQWRFDEGSGSSPEDYSRNRQTALLQAGAKWVQAQAGYGVFLDGEGAHIELPRSGTLDQLNRSSYSVAIRFRPESLPSCEGRDDGEYGLILREGWHEGLYYGSAGAFHLSHWLGDENPVNVAVESARHPFSPGRWYHVAGVVDADARRVRLYVDGRLEGVSPTWPAGLPPRSYGDARWRVGIGAPGATSTWAAHGTVGELRVFADALRGVEVWELANGEKS